MLEVEKKLSSRSVEIGGKQVGGGAPSWIVIELGVTHEGDSNLARRMVRDSRAAGADAVKVECIFPDALVAASHRASLPYSYTSMRGTNIVENYYELLQRVALSPDEIKALRDYAGEEGIPFFATAFDLKTVDYLVEIQSCAVKISSGEVSHLPLIRHAAQSGLPVIIDTGRSSLADIARAVHAAEQAGCPIPVVMHNPSGYPAKPQNVNLPAIPALKAALDVPVGFSCHSPGNDMALAAAALGADIIEKPTTRDSSLEADEHAFSVNMHELGDYVSRIRDIELAMRLDRAKFFPPADPNQFTFRQSLVALQDIVAGDEITQTALGFARPGFGIPPEFHDTVLGRRTKRSVASGSLLSWDDIL